MVAARQLTRAVAACLTVLTVLSECPSGVVAGGAGSLAGCSLLEACHSPASCAVLHETPPAAFGVSFRTTKGDFVVNVNTSWAPPYAQRLWVLAKLSYFDGGPFFRVLNMPHAKPHPQAFVAQFGYRGDPAVDNCWDAHLTSNTTWSVAPPGNVRGSVTFAMDAVANTGANPNCSSTASYCAQGFSSNIFVNLQDNSALLDPPGFSPVGTVDEAGMAVVDALYAGYGEVASLCPAGASDPFCVGTGAACKGVNVTTLLREGDAYVAAKKPLLDRVISVSVTSA